MRLFARLTSTVSLMLAAVLPFAPVAARKPPPPPALTRVQFNTSIGQIVVALETRRAPATAANFLTYVDDKRFDGTLFYRAARAKYDQRQGFVQGGIKTDARRILPPFPLETTDRTGIHHVSGTISMARREDPDSAGGNYFICVGPCPSMDAAPGKKGYAAFGHVIQGMDVVRKILAQPTGGGSDGMRRQMLVRPIRILSVKRLDGVANPTGQVKPWLIPVPR